MNDFLPLRVTSFKKIYLFNCKWSIFKLSTGAPGFILVVCYKKRIINILKGADRQEAGFED